MLRRGRKRVEPGHCPLYCADFREGLVLRHAASTALALFVALIVGPFAPDAFAAAFSVEARTEAQAYQFRAWRGTGPNDVTLLPRRRIVQYLGAEGYELVTGQDLGFAANLR